MIRSLLQLLAFLSLGAGAAFQALAGSADIEGSISYQISGDRITIEIDRIVNNTDNLTTGTLYVTVHATTNSSPDSAGYYLARHQITGSSSGQLGPGQFFSNFRVTLDYSQPPAGTYYVHFFTSQYPNVDTILDSRTFTDRLIVSGGGGGGSGGSADIEGAIAYQTSGDRITVEIERIANNTSNLTTGTLYVTVRMTESSSVNSSGYNVARHQITGSSSGQLGPGQFFSNLRWTLDYSRPPPGTYYVHFWTSQYPNLNTVLDSRTFTERATVGGGRGGGGDHGDDAASAARVSANSTTAASLEQGGDKDFFRIELSQTGDLRVETTGNTDTFGILRGTDASLLRVDDDSGEGSNFRITFNDAAPGVYYIEVRGFSTNTTGDYSLQVSFTPAGGTPPVDLRPSFAAGSGPGDLTYTVGAAIDALTLPVASGGDGTLSYTLAPEVPGLSFDPATRQLSGTPTTAGTYALTYTVTDADGDTDTLSFAISVQAEASADGSLPLHEDNRWPVGIAHADGRFHVVDYWDLKVYAYRTDGQRDESADFDLHEDNDWPAGIVHVGDRFHVVDWWDEKIYAYRADGQRDESADFDMHEDNGWPAGIVYVSDRFYVVDWWDDKVYAYRADGQRDESADFDLQGDNGWPTGIAHDGDRFNVVDEGDDKVYAYLADGQRDESAEFDLRADNDDPAGIVHVDGRFHVVDAGDETIYPYPPDGVRATCGPGDHDFTLSGVVRDGGGNAVSGANVTVSSVDCDYSYVTGSDGSFDLTFDTNTVPERIAVVVHRDGYAPSAFPVDTSDRNSADVGDVSIETLGPGLVVLELVPEIHHLGDDSFTGAINSGFQRSAEGTEFQRTFSLSTVQAQASSATITMLAKGLQRQNPLEINGHLIGYLNNSPSDGSYGTVTFSVPTDTLQSGANTLVIESATGFLDHDDFEFTNVILRFTF